MKRCAATALIAAGVAGGAVGTALAATEKVGGGTWAHGTTLTTSYSNYYHETRCHGSTAVGTSTVRSGDTRAGRTATAEAPRAAANNQAYWRNTC